MIEYKMGVGLLIIGLLLGMVIIGGAYILGIKEGDEEKITVYECGFDPYGDTRQKYEIRFFLVGILFIIFDLEISFIFPWAIVVREIGMGGNIVIYIFLGILTIGLIVEWIKGGLDWE